MREILLPNGKCTIVDDEDFEWLNQWKWHQNPKGYVIRSLWYPKRHSILMARLIMNAPPNKQVDHRNGNPLANWRENLRITDVLGNLKNRKKPSNNTSGYKGVNFIRVNMDKTRVYEARITVDYISIPLGKFGSAIEAAKAYDEAALKYHGEYANLNFP